MTHVFGKKLSMTFVLMALLIPQLHAQRVGIKTNALYWGALSPNLGLEFRLSRCFTLNLEGDFSPMKVKDYKLRHASFAPEVRYWFSGRPQARHFVGVMGLLSAYDLSWSKKEHEGLGGGAGLTYGYAFVLGRRWSLETTIGAGLFHYREKKFTVGEQKPTGTNHTGVAFVPLKLGVTFTYLIK